MVAHEHIGMELNSVGSYSQGEDPKKSDPVLVILKNRSSLIPTASYMVPGTRVFNAQRSDHVTRMAEYNSLVK